METTIMGYIGVVYNPTLHTDGHPIRLSTLSVIYLFCVIPGADDPIRCGTLTSPFPLIYHYYRVGVPSNRWDTLNPKDDINGKGLQLPAAVPTGLWPVWASQFW